MENKLVEVVTIPFRGGSINCRLNLAAIFAAETETNIPILSPGTPAFSDRPVFVQLSLLAYALICSAGMKTSMAEVHAMLAGPKSAYIAEQVTKIMPSYEAQLENFNKQFDKCV